jgi:hypothetical protein
MLGWGKANRTKLLLCCWCATADGSVLATGNEKKAQQKSNHRHDMDEVM